ncbi:MAG TPA: YciI family protein [Baekduia sp.]|nr:YciI family protein [Baekduia sp.]
MSQYLLLLYREPSGPPTPAEVAEQMPKWFALDEAMKEAGVYVGGNALQGVDTATTVEIGAGEPLVVDGPFAETKEILGGYYLIDVPDLDEALRWAKRVPYAAGKVEVRPIMPLEAFKAMLEGAHQAG